MRFVHSECQSVLLFFFSGREFSPFFFSSFGASSDETALFFLQKRLIVIRKKATFAVEGNEKCNNMKQTVFPWIRDFFSLFYPDYCIACGARTVSSERFLCSSCELHLPRTGDAFVSPNPTERLFWGRLPVTAAAAYFQFRKGGGVQLLVHQLKYKDRPDIGRHFGRIFGEELKQNPIFSTVDALVPIPLHPKRLRQRGYNQSREIAEGIAASLQKPVRPDILIRRTATQTQTKRSSFQRWENVSSVFSVADSARLEGLHLLLVDDVITTGSTMEAAASALLEVPGVRVGLAALAVDVF